MVGIGLVHPGQCQLSLSTYQPTVHHPAVSSALLSAENFPTWVPIPCPILTASYFARIPAHPLWEREVRWQRLFIVDLWHSLKFTPHRKPQTMSIIIEGHAVGFFTIPLLTCVWVRGMTISKLCADYEGSAPVKPCRKLANSVVDFDVMCPTNQVWSHLIEGKY
jgi:hypothetical protein